jgi:Gpi18-like mannosyltransferase
VLVDLFLLYASLKVYLHKVAALLIYLATDKRILLTALYYLNSATIYTSSIYGMFDPMATALLLTALIMFEKIL